MGPERRQEVGNPVHELPVTLLDVQAYPDNQGPGNGEPSERKSR